MRCRLTSDVARESVKASRNSPAHAADLPALVAWIGKTLEVVIDRKAGTSHPEHPMIVYLVDYGYIPGTLSGDGEPLDVYLIGSRTHGRRRPAQIIGFVLRYSEDDPKMIAVHPGYHASATEIVDSVEQHESSRDHLTLVSLQHLEIRESIRGDSRS